MTPRIGVLLPSGGLRCFYQLGVLEQLRHADLDIRLLAGVSGGALAAVGFLSQTATQMLAGARAIVRLRMARLAPRRVLSGRSPFVHGEVLEREMRAVLDDTRLRAVLEAEAELHIMAAALEGGRSYALSGAPVMLAHALEIGPLRRLWLHPRVGRAVGFRAHWFRPDAATTSPDALFEMLLATSCFPPLTRPIGEPGRRFYDGAFASSMPPMAPFRARDDLDEVWVVHTRRDQRNQFPDVPGVRHISPSRPLGVGIWDFNGGETGIVRTFLTGERDGRALCEKLVRETRARRVS